MENFELDNARKLPKICKIIFDVLNIEWEKWSKTWLRAKNIEWETHEMVMVYDVMKHNDKIISSTRLRWIFGFVLQRFERLIHNDISSVYAFFFLLSFSTIEPHCFHSNSMILISFQWLDFGNEIEKKIIK